MLMRTEEAGLKSSVIPDVTRKSSLATGQLNVFYLRNFNLNAHTSETSFPAGSFWKENDQFPSLSSVTGNALVSSGRTGRMSGALCILSPSWCSLIGNRVGETILATQEADDGGITVVTVFMAFS